MSQRRKKVANRVDLALIALWVAIIVVAYAAAKPY